MLDIQRQRSRMLHSEIVFTRYILAFHLLAGVIVATLMTAHGVLTWAVAASLWYLISLIPLHGMMQAQECCRHCLGFLFIAFSLTGTYFLWAVELIQTEEHFALLPPAVIPFWLGILNILYAFAGVCLMSHRKVRKAATIGFSLW